MKPLLLFLLLNDTLTVSFTGNATANFYGVAIVGAIVIAVLIFILTRIKINKNYNK